MTTLTDNVIAIETPPDSNNYRILRFSTPNTLIYDYSITKGNGGSLKIIAMIDLPPGSWSILGLATELTEEQAGEVVELRNYAPETLLEAIFKDVSVENYHHAFITLLRSHNLKPDNLLILKKK